MTNKILIALMIPLLVASCSDSNSPAGDEATSQATAAETDRVKLSAEQAQKAGIVVGDVLEKETYGVIKASGVLEVPPHNVYSIGVPMGGFLKKMLLIPGQRVHKGQLLATLEDQQYIQLQEDYLMAKNRLRVLASDFERQRTLNQTKATSDKVFQQVAGDFESQKIASKALAEKLRLLGINPDNLHENNISRSIAVYSPISGFVTEVNVHNGRYVSPTDVICELVNPRDLHLSLKAFDHSASRLTAGQKVTFYPNADSSRKYKAQVHLINPSIGGERTFEVHCDILDNNHSLLPGTFVNAEIQTNNLVTTVLPDEAIVRWNNKPYVFVEEDTYSYRMVPVEAGAATGGFSEIRSKLDNRKVVVKNAYTLLMALKNSAEEG